MLAFAENKGKRTALLLGENSWKWRMQSHINEDSFDKYDLFVDKIIQYLSSGSSKKALVVNHENFYNSGDAIEITAQYFNKNYEFDANAQLTIAIENKTTKDKKTFDMLKTNAAYAVNLDGLAPGNYSFKITERSSKESYSSTFEILDFDIEKQFVNSDYKKLQQLAERTEGSVYYPKQVTQLIQNLVDDTAYQAIQKSNTTRSPLIDWHWLLVLIALFLGTEWFVRKYNGML